MKSIKKKVMVALATVATMVVGAVSLVACSGTPGVKLEASQIDALNKVNLNKADVAIIDSTMAGYLLSKDDYSNLEFTTEIPGVTLEKEFYGVAAKKGNQSLINVVNKGIADMKESGKLNEVAKQYGLESRLIEQEQLKGDTIYGETNAYEYVAKDATDGAWAKIQEEKKITIGFTENAPMGIKNGEEVSGFDIDLARAIFEPMGIKVETKLISWEMKEAELDSNKIDLVWNGLTVTQDRYDNMCVSMPYLVNTQAFVMKKGNKEKYDSLDELKQANISVEIESAGQDLVESLGLTILKD